MPDFEKDRQAIEQELKKGNYVGHHSDLFGKTYDPHYRLVSKKIILFKEIIFLSKNIYLCTRNGFPSRLREVGQEIKWEPGENPGQFPLL